MKILLIKRDWIGDLICAMPMIEMLRKTFPHATINMLLNNYIKPIMIGNRNVDKIYSYDRTQHTKGIKRISSSIKRLLIIYKLRKEKFDLAILVNGLVQPTGLELIKWIKPKQWIGYVADKKDLKSLAILIEDRKKAHQCEMTYHLLNKIGINEELKDINIDVADDIVRKIEQIIRNKKKEFSIGIHLSASSKEKRWSIDKFTNVLDYLTNIFPNISFIAFWSPGSQNDLLYPGDDERTLPIREKLSHKVIFLPTKEIRELIAGVSIVDCMLCLDSGATHIASALKKPTFVLFGSGDQEIWYPWNVPSVVVQPESRYADDVLAEDIKEELVKFINAVREKQQNYFNQPTIKNDRDIYFIYRDKKPENLDEMVRDVA